MRLDAENCHLQAYISKIKNLIRHLKLFSPTDWKGITQSGLKTPFPTSLWVRKRHFSQANFRGWLLLMAVFCLQITSTCLIGSTSTGLIGSVCGSSPLHCHDGGRVLSQLTSAAVHSLCGALAAWARQAWEMQMMAVGMGTQSHCQQSPKHSPAPKPTALFTSKPSTHALQSPGMRQTGPGSAITQW